MFSRLKSASVPVLALLALFMAGCDPKIAAKVLFQPYHDPFDTSALAEFSEIPASEVEALGKFMDRASPSPKADDEASFSPTFRPFGTLSLAGKEGADESCIAYDRRIECANGREYDIAAVDVAAYRDLMKRIDSLDQARRGTARAIVPPLSTPDVPIN